MLRLRKNRIKIISRLNKVEMIQRVMTTRIRKVLVVIKRRKRRRRKIKRRPKLKGLKKL